MEKSGLSKADEIYVFGSYLRHTLYNDVDVLVVHRDGLEKHDLDEICSVIEARVKEATAKGVDFELVDKSRFPSYSLIHDNKERIY